MKKWIFRIVLSIILLLVILWFALKFYLSFSTADYEGEILQSHVDSEIEISFDSLGVPQIWASTDKDLFFALGWVHASERLFQMELIRRVAKGELSELFGEELIEFDKFQRTIGFYRRTAPEINNLNAEDKQLLVSYCAGINSWIDYKNVLPPEFFVLQLKPEYWDLADVASIMYYQTWFAHFLMDHEKEYDKLINAFDNDLLNSILKQKLWSPTTVAQSLSQKFRLGSQMSYASNSWVVSPDKSSSNFALHASDPHLQINSIPGFWYAVGLHSNEGTNIVGITAPSIPFVVMGHNQKTAFAFTVASLDLIDYYNEKINPLDSTEVLTPTGYSKISSITDSIIVKGRDQKIAIEILTTELGAVVEKDSTGFTTLKWAGFDCDINKIISAGFDLHKTQDFNSFRKTVTSFGALDVNWTYSDIEGNIGYQLGSPIPIRNFRSSFSKLPGEDSLYRWKGYRKLDETPFEFNPAKGFIASSNNQIVGKSWQYEIPGFYDPYRIVRSTEILDRNGNFDQNQFGRMQQDMISVKGRRWKNLLADGAEILGELKLRDSFLSWDGNSELGHDESAVFQIWWYYLIKEIFKDQLNDNWKLGQYIIEQTLTDKNSSLIDNVITLKTETLEEISANALDSVLTKYPNVKLEDISFHSLEHPLARVKLLDYWLNLNRGPFPIGGDASTLNANFNYFDENEIKIKTIVGPSMRFVLDWANVNEFKLITNMGQSGNPFSDHYDDFLPFMQQGKYRSLPFSRDAILKKSKSILKLLPEKLWN